MSVKILNLQDRYGYTVNVKGMQIFQEYAPALGGKIKMTEKQAAELANLVEQKLIQYGVASVDSEQIYDLWDGKRTMQKIIDDELELIGSAVDNGFLE